MKRWKYLGCWGGLLLAGWACAAEPPETAHFDGAGRLVMLAAAGEPVRVTGEVRVAGPNWGFIGYGTTWAATGVVFAAAEGESVWSGFIPLANGGLARYEQRVQSLTNGARISLEVRAENDLPLEGVYYGLQLPVRDFAEGQAAFWRGTSVVAAAQAPSIYKSEQNPRFLNGDAERVTVQADPYRIRVGLDRPRAVVLQDDREWGSLSYTLLIGFGRGPRMPRGETARLNFTLELAGEPDRDPVQVVLAPNEPAGERFEGFGGNFVYGLDSAMTTSLIERLEPVRARVEMALFDWEPENDNTNSDHAAWSRFEARDVEGSAMRTRFELAAQLAKRGVPLMISVWSLPEWMYEGPPQGRGVGRRTVPEGLWPEVLESAGTYLLHLKNRYGVEPELFSFNEPELGVRVLFTAEQHRDMIRRFGERFEALGLKTRVMLADVAQPRGTESYGVYALSDPACIPRIGSVAFHTWGGGTALEYEAWRRVARRFGLPLDVTELGLDGGVYRTPHEMATPRYAIQEAHLMVQVLAHARPRSALLWEYTDDYPLLAESRDAAGNVILRDTLRLRFLEQLIRGTPKPAEAVGVRSSRLEIAAAAFRPVDAIKGTSLVLHLVNASAARLAEITGLPEDLKRMEAVILPVAGAVPIKKSVIVKQGRAELKLPAWSLVTLTQR
ncbi:MAG: hypothetical protein R6X19_05255 [Kiritimatiellia bacterium]